MNKYKKLFNNTLIFAIGNLGNRLITFFLVPFYTFYLTTSEFGTVDLLITTINLLLPVISFSIYDAILRFVLESKDQSKEIFSSSLIITFFGLGISVFIYPFFGMIEMFEGYFFYFYLLLIFQALNKNLLQFVRAQNQIKLYTVSSLFMTLVTLILTIILMKYFQLGISGYLYSLIGANLSSLVLLFLAGKVYNYIDFRSINVGTMKMLLLYSLPLIPNALMWWIMQLSDRFLVTFFLGVGANGLYAVANKIPNLLSIVNTIFFQAWQISAIEESNNSDNSAFFNSVFSILFSVMLVSTSSILLILRVLVKYLIAPEFYTSWRYIPFLLIAIVFSSFSGFLGTNYISMKKTSGILKTSVWGALANIILNIVLIPIFGINGASFATMVSFGIIFVFRVIDTRNFVRIKINIMQFLSSFCIIFIQVILMLTEKENIHYLSIPLFLILILLQIPTYRIVRDLLTNKSTSLV